MSRLQQKLALASLDESARRVVQALLASKRGLLVGTIAQRTGLKRRTVRRTLKRLSQMFLVEGPADGKDGPWRLLPAWERYVPVAWELTGESRRCGLGP